LNYFEASELRRKLQDGYTALHVAVQSGKPKVIEALLGQGANVHVLGGALQQVRSLD
jgi:ankyrin repeat protein